MAPIEITSLTGQAGGLATENKEGKRRVVLTVMSVTGLNERKATHHPPYIFLMR